ncbi:MAG: type IV secretion system DNA-binding domain-containing protein [Candidatus Cloacimonetes bacterium]|nr:type IV secretion system DNA-binding domain-containing protein [Candidatus Cloacimonadota bacterium]
MKKIEVFEGNVLHDRPITYPVNNPMCSFQGIDETGSNLSVPLDADLLSRHLMFLGGIGTGKTNALDQIISQLRKSMTANDVMIIFDTKGDFYRSFYQKGDIVISNDNTATGQEGVDYWNIFNEIENDENMEANIVEISKALFHQKLEKTNQPFFPMAAKDLFSAVLTHFTRNKDTLHADNLTLRNFLDSSPTAELREMLSGHSDMKAMISYISNDNSPQTQGVMSELQQLSREILLGNFKKQGSLAIRNLVRAKGGKIVFIEYDIGIGAMLSPIYSLLFDLAIKEALCRQKSEGNVYFIADEFRLIPNLQHVDDAVNFGRSLGVKFMIGIQNVEQVYECYGEQRARSIMSGFLTSIAFRVNDATSKHYIKNLHGENRKRETFMSTIQTRGIVENVREAFVVEDWDISNLGLGEAIIGLPGKPPFRFRFIKAGSNG